MALFSKRGGFAIKRAFAVPGSGIDAANAHVAEVSQQAGLARQALPGSSPCSLRAAQAWTLFKLGPVARAQEASGSGRRRRPGVIAGRLMVLLGATALVGFPPIPAAHAQFVIDENGPDAPDRGP